MASTQPPEHVGPGAGHAQVRAGPLRGDVAITPNRVGRPNVVTLRLDSAVRRPRSQGVTVRFSMLTMPMGPLTFPMRRAAPGVYRYEGPALTMSGRWRLTFTVHLSGGGQRVLTVDDEVR